MSSVNMLICCFYVLSPLRLLVYFISLVIPISTCSIQKQAPTNK
jgi:hypothetical protein